MTTANLVSIRFLWVSAGLLFAACSARVESAHESQEPKQNRPVLWTIALESDRSSWLAFGYELELDIHSEGGVQLLASGNNGAYQWQLECAPSEYQMIAAWTKLDLPKDSRKCLHTDFPGRARQTRVVDTIQYSSKVITVGFHAASQLKLTLWHGGTETYKRLQDAARRQLSKK